MFVKYINSKGETVTFDNSNASLGNVKIEGDNLNDVKALEFLINTRTQIRGVTTEDISKNPNKYKLIKGIVHLDTASDRFLQKELPTIMKNRGYKISSN